MNVETKYLIRWGIPGWVFILFISIMTYLIFHPDIKLDEVNLVDILGLLVSAGFVGVPIGYLFHQLYFSYNWLGNRRVFDEAVKIVVDQSKITRPGWGDNGHKDYFYFEHVWQKELLKIDDNDKRVYLSERYRHLLTTIHGLGALWVSLAFSLAVNIIFFIYHFREMDKMPSAYLIILGLFNTYLLLAVYKGFKYYSDNLNHFQGHFFNAFFSNELKLYKEQSSPSVND